MPTTQIAAPAAVLALVVLAAGFSLWWFVAASAATLVLLNRLLAHASPRPMHNATILSLVCYALLLSIALLTVRAALGLLELPLVPFEHTRLAPALKHSSLGFYDKSEIRLALFALGLLAITFAIVLVQAGNLWLARSGKLVVLHPATALFAFVSYFAAVRLPPYPLDPAWAVTGGPESALLQAWLAALGASALSISAVAALCNLAAGWASFVLIRRLTGSAFASMLGASYALFEGGTLHGDSIALPAPSHVALAMLFLYIGLRDRPRLPWPSFLLGLLLPLEPVFGAAALVAFPLALACQPQRPDRLRVVAAMICGASACAIAIAILATLGAALPPLASAATVHERLAPPVLPLLIPALLIVALFLNKASGLRAWTARRLFVCASFVCAVPSVILAVTRFEPAEAFQVLWILVPVFALGIHTLIRLATAAARSRRLRSVFSMSLTALAFVVLFDIIFPAQRLYRVVEKYATAYEAERQRWYRLCARGQACDLARKPSLALYLKQSRQSLLPAEGARRGPT